MNKAPYKHLLVTGGAGFIGANFIRFLLEQDDFQGEIINLDALTYAGNPENLNGLAEAYPQRYTFIKGNITDADLLGKVFSSHCIDSVCHFAAESHVDRSIEQPLTFIETNIIGTFQLLEASLHQRHFLRFHQIGTDEVFGSLGKRGHFRETTPYRPNSPYSASKASSDHLVRAYHHTYGLPTSMTNCSNNFGPYQFPEKLIPLIILNALEYKPLPIYGDGLNVRDWLYVEDHCRAIWQVMRDAGTGQTFTVGGGNEWTNLQLVEHICDLLDDMVGRSTDNKPRRDLITFVRDRPGHDRRYAIDSSKIQRIVGWYPRETMAGGLSKTITWYLDNRDWVHNIQRGAYRAWLSHHYGDST